MTLKFIDDIRTEITALLPDNSSGQISPQDLRTCLQDMTDSLFTRGCGLYGTFGSPIAIALTTTPTVQPNVLATSVNVNPIIFTVNQPASTITLHAAGFVHNFAIAMSVDGSANTEVLATLYKNGAPVIGAQMGVNLTGAGDIHTASIGVLQTGILDGDVFSLRFSSNPGATINFHAAQLVAQLLPTTQPN